ncbi:MAG: FtsX-like permease family protein [Rhodanobacter sp.]|nr:MAG: FtsX-like permease family protein [Rhodanobacter sp.]
MHPIISALKHHKTAVILMVLEIALTCAIVSNAIFIIGNRLAAMHVQTGVVDNELVWARSSGLDQGASAASATSRAQADLAALRSMPGVTSAVMVNSLPLSNMNAWGACVQRRPGHTKDLVCNVILYAGTQGTVKTLGIKLVQGRDFLPQEYVNYFPFDDMQAPPAVIVTRSLADRLWPGKDPLGQPLFLGDKARDVTHVVGVVGHLVNPRINKYNGVERNLLLPVTAAAVRGGMYVLRTAPGARDATLRDLPKVLDGVDSRRIITERHSYAQTVKDYFHDDRALIWLLLVVIGCLLALSALGVVGLSSFWVQQRTHQIGIRRAIGATRRDIMLYFQIENLLIVGAGIALGSLCAVVLSLFLMKHYELPRLPLGYLPIGALVLWALGQLAVLGPALRAAAVPPVVATRSV